MPTNLIPRHRWRIASTKRSENLLSWLGLIDERLADGVDTVVDRKGVGILQRGNDIARVYYTPLSVDPSEPNLVVIADGVLAYRVER